MKRFLFILLLAACGFTSFADGLSERTYLVTDRQTYVAGDRLWCSAFCVDASTGRLSDFSAIAYIELHNASGMVATGKVALAGGRGATVIDIPAGLPTGNYRLLAYTRQNRNETGYDYARCARTVSIFNPASSARVPGGVEIVTSIPERAPARPSEGGLSISVQADAGQSSVVPVRINLPGNATLSVSVWHDDGLPFPENCTVAEFLSDLEPGRSFDYRFIPEYEGEVINGRVVGMSPAQADSIAGYSAFISVPGDLDGLYSASIRKDGTMSFFTNNIYGDRELVCEIENMGSRSPGHVELESPFVNVPVTGIPALKISPDMGDLISRRAAASKIERCFSADSLYDALPVKANPLFSGKSKTYSLDDYTRFPVMEEVVTEYVKEMRVRTRDGRRRIELLMSDFHDDALFSGGNSLLLMDGVPVFDQEKIVAYDPLLVKKISIFPYTHFVGRKSFEGIVNFETYKGTMPDMEFDSNVRIYDFSGPAYPMAYTCGGLSSGGEYPDYRQTLYWHPLLEAEAGGQIELPVVLPAYSGRFVVVAEGITADGKPLYATASFDNIAK